jgi:hypothetical protein
MLKTGIFAQRPEKGHLGDSRLLSITGLDFFIRDRGYGAERKILPSKDSHLIRPKGEQGD